MFFKSFINLLEAVDPSIRDAILSSKWPYAKEKIQQATQELEKAYEGKPSPTKANAFQFIHQTLGHERKRNLPPPPVEPNLKKYYDQLVKKEITIPEYKLAAKYKDEIALDDLMKDIRQLIKNRVISIDTKNEPKIVYGKEVIGNLKNFTQLAAYIHSIKGQQEITEEDKPKIQEAKSDPKLLAISNAADLVYHVPADPKTGKKDIWVFKGDDPLKCRAMGKGQEWCISSSAMTKWYFTYRHKNGQTQYFIFDYNKEPNDPARYVNPGIGPEKTDPHYGKIPEAGSEWVDEKNHPDQINGYKSVDDYKKYLQEMGVPLRIFKSDPLTQVETKLFKLVDEKDWEEAYKDPEIWKLYWQLVESLPDEAYNKLNDEEKIQFRKSKWGFLSQQQMKDAILLYKTNPKKFEEWAKSTPHANPSEIYDTASQILSINPKQLLKDFIRMKGIIGRAEADYLVEKFGNEGIQLLKDNQDKFANIYTWIPITLATGEMPENLEELVNDANDDDSALLVNGYLRNLSNSAFVQDNQKALEALYKIKPEILKKTAQRGTNSWVEELPKHKNLYKDVNKLISLDDFLKEKLGWSQSFIKYFGNANTTTLHEILTNDYPENVKEYIATHIHPSIVPEFAVGKTKYGGSYGIKDEIRDQRRREESEKASKTFINVLDKQINSLNKNAIAQIVQSYPHKQELLNYLKNKGINLEELFWEKEQIIKLIKNIDTQAESWPEVIDSMKLLGPEVLGKLSNNDIMHLIRKTLYYPGIKAETASQIIPYLKVTSENLENILYNLQYASDDNIDKLASAIDPEVIKNADKDLVDEWFMRRLSIDAPPSIFTKQQFANLNPFALAEALAKDKIPSRYITPELIQKVQNYVNDPKASLGKHTKEKLVAKLNTLMSPVHHP